MAKSGLQETSANQLVQAALKYAAARQSGITTLKKESEPNSTACDKLELSTKRLRQTTEGAAKRSKTDEDPIASLWQRIKDDPSYFEGYTMLIKLLRKNGTENRAELKLAYEMLLAEYPLCYGYWIRLAVLEGSSWAETEATLEKGCSFVPGNPHIWTTYIDVAKERKALTTEQMRSLMDRALDKCGYHWTSFNLWKGCIEYEENILKELCQSDTLSHQERQTREASASSRLRRLYNEVLRRPINKLDAAWEMFKGIVGMGESRGVSLDVTDLIVSEELPRFQEFVMSTYNHEPAKKTQENQNLKTVGRSDGEKLIDVEIEFGDKLRLQFRVDENVKLRQVVEACAAARSSDQINLTTVDLLYGNRVLGLDHTLAEENIVNNSTLIFFDGSKLAKVLTMASGRALERWFLKLREEVYQETLKTRTELESFEGQLKRNYFHPLPLGNDQLRLWRKYLDYAEESLNERHCSMIYGRALETCCNYPEFWRRFADRVETRGSVMEATNVYLYASAYFLKRRPDIRLIYAEFCEKHQMISKAKHVLEEIIKGDNAIAPGLLEAYVRLVGIHRRAGEHQECCDILDECHSILKDRPLERARAAMEHAYYQHTYRRDLPAALSILAKEWATGQSLALLKYYVSLLRADPSTKYSKIALVYEQGLTSSVENTVSQYMIWKDFLHFAEREAPDISHISSLKARFNTFVKNAGEKLEECKKGSLESGSITTGPSSDTSIKDQDGPVRFHNTVDSKRDLDFVDFMLSLVPRIQKEPHCSSCIPSSVCTPKYAKQAFDASMRNTVGIEYAKALKFEIFEKFMLNEVMLESRTVIPEEELEQTRLTKLWLLTAGRRFNLHRDVIYSAISIFRYLLSDANYVAFCRQLNGNFLLHTACTGLCLSTKYHDAAQPVSFHEAVKVYNELNNGGPHSSQSCSIYYPLLEHIAVSTLPPGSITAQSASQILDWCLLSLGKTCFNGIWHNNTTDVAENEDSPAYCLLQLVLCSKLIEKYTVSNVGIAVSIVLFLLRVCCIHKGEQQLVSVIGSTVLSKAEEYLDLVYEIVFLSAPAHMTEYELGFLNSTWWLDLQQTAFRLIQQTLQKDISNDSVKEQKIQLYQ